LRDLLKQFSLDGKVAVVTGASEGIGEGLALAWRRRERR
jgi:NAD(P)-dependent dehydrogenase (short-subunit alcohol dehydrogenase family)